MNAPAHGPVRAAPGPGCSRWLRTGRSFRRNPARSVAAGSGMPLPAPPSAPSSSRTARSPGPGPGRASGPGRARRRRGTGSSSAHRRCCSRIRKCPTAPRAARRNGSALPPHAARSGPATCPDNSASPAAASGIRTSSRSTTAAWRRHRLRSATGPARTRFPAATAPGRWRRNCTIALRRRAGRNSPHPGDARPRCSRSTADGGRGRKGSRTPSARTGRRRGPGVRVPGSARARGPAPAHHRIACPARAGSAWARRPLLVRVRCLGRCRWQARAPGKAVLRLRQRQASASESGQCGPASESLVESALVPGAGHAAAIVSACVCSDASMRRGLLQEAALAREPPRAVRGKRSSAARQFAVLPRPPRAGFPPAPRGCRPGR